MKQNYTFLYILDSSENTEELYNYDYIVTGSEIAGITDEEPSPDVIRRILDYAAL